MNETNFDDFSYHVKNALVHLYDLCFLETSPLTDWLLPPAREWGVSRGQALRDLLLEGIEAFRPAPTTPIRSRVWRSYLVLRHRYVDQTPAQEIEDELALSPRQIQREQRKALEAIARWLWNQVPSLASPSDDPLGQELQHLAVHPEPVSLAVALREAWQTVRCLAEEQGVSLNESTPKLALSVQADAGLLHQGLVYLLRSALEYGRSQEITVTMCSRRGEAEIILTKPALLPLAPESSKAHASFAVAQRLLEHARGRVAMATEGSQARWLLTLPLAGPYTVLVVDDNEAAIRLFERYLTGEEFRVMDASNGETALRLANEAQPHVIMLDLMLPRRDGWQILQTLKESAATTHIPVVVCSVLRDHELARALGAAGCIQKPVSRSTLLQTLRSVLRRQTPMVETIHE